MVQVINKDSRSSMLGRAVGGALSETLPKEVDRYRLSSGLNELANNDRNLSPFQQYAKLAGIPGITPSILEGASNLLKNQGIRNAYQNAGGAAGNPGVYANTEGQQSDQEQRIQGPGNTVSQAIRDVGFAGQPNSNRSAAQAVSPSGEAQVIENNPTRQSAEPKRRWSQSQFEAERAAIANQFPYSSPQEIERMTAEKEQRYLAGPESEQKIDEYQNKIRADIQTELDRQLQKKLQKTSEGTYKDASGELQEEVKRLVERDIKKDPNLTVNDAVNQRTNQLLDFAKSKSNFNKLANRSVFSKLAPGKGAQIYDDLKQLQNSYDRLNRNEEMFTELQNGDGFNLSRRGAASVAYPNQKVKGLPEYIKNAKKSTLATREADAIKQAIEIEPFLSNQKASPLAIAKALGDKDPNFDDLAFIRQLREDLRSGNLILHPEQERQLEDAGLPALPTWGDIFTFPILRGL